MSKLHGSLNGSIQDEIPFLPANTKNVGILRPDAEAATIADNCLPYPAELYDERNPLQYVFDDPNTLTFRPNLPSTLVFIQIPKEIAVVTKFQDMPLQPFSEQRRKCLRARSNCPKS